MAENINWDELKKKVEADLQNDINNEVQTIKDINDVLGEDKGIVHLRDLHLAKTLKNPESDAFFSCSLTPKNIDIDPFNLWGTSEEEDTDDTVNEDNEDNEEEVDYSCDQDYLDQGGFICPHSEIEKYAWNNADKQDINNKNDIYCIHLSNENDSYKDDVYIYPLSDKQDICLCNNCNRELAAKIMEQIATELFI
jgi:hypothetical protein